VAAVRQAGGHEVDLAAFLGPHRRPQRLRTRQGDRRGRQSRPGVGIVRTIALEVRAAKVAVERRAEAVDHRGIGLQSHAAPEPQREDARDAGPLRGKSRLLLDDRREDQCLVGLVDRQVVGAPTPRRVEFAAHAGPRLAQDLQVRRALAEEVGVGEEQALGVHARLAQRLHHRCVVPARECVVDHRAALEGTAEVAEGPALDEGHRVLHHGPRFEQFEQAARRRARRYLVLACLDARIDSRVAGIGLQPVRVLEDAARFEFARRDGQRLATRNLDLQRRIGDRQRAIEPALQGRVAGGRHGNRDDYQRKGRVAQLHAVALDVHSSSARVTWPGAS
jgi:hypothetical protein